MGVIYVGATSPCDHSSSTDTSGGENINLIYYHHCQSWSYSNNGGGLTHFKLEACFSTCFAILFRKRGFPPPPEHLLTHWVLKVLHLQQIF